MQPGISTPLRLCSEEDLLITASFAKMQDHMLRTPKPRIPTRALTRKHVLLAIVLAAGLSAAALSPISASAQDTQPIGAFNDAPATIEGTVDRIIENTFVVQDGTGEMIVETAPPWYMDIDLSPGATVTVAGEVEERQEGPPKMEAFTIRTESGDVIEIRNGPGPPPWAGGPDSQ